MGGVGSILVLLSFVPYVGFVLGLAGFVMVLLAVKQISEVVRDREIFNNVLMAVILQIVGSAISAFVVIGGLLSTFMMAPLGSPFDGFGGPGMFGAGAALAILGSLIVGLIVMWVILIIAARFLRKGYEGIATKTGTETFRSVGRWYYHGAWLAIVVVGFVLTLIAAILQIVAFFSLPESPPNQPIKQFKLKVPQGEIEAFLNLAFSILKASHL
jgi:uncharacterized membrane protein